VTDQTIVSARSEEPSNYEAIMQPMNNMPSYDQPEMKDWDNFNPSDLPEAIINELMAYKQRDHDDNFRLGRIVIALRAGLDAERVRVPIMRLYKAVGHWAGVSSEHARQCYMVAKNVNASLERQYSDQISFHQWKSLVPHCDTPGEYHAKINGWLDHCAETGVSVTSVDGIRGWLNPDSTLEILIGRHQRLYRDADRIASDRELPDPIRRVYRYFIQELDTTIRLNNLKDWEVRL